MTQGILGKFITFVFIIGVFLCSTGCSHHITNGITSRIIPEDIYNSDHKVQPKDLSTDSKCSTPPSIRIVNTDSRTEDFKCFEIRSNSYFIKPYEIMESAASYLRAGYYKSGIKANDNSSKIIEMKLTDIEYLSAVWSHGSKVRIEVSIPEAKLYKIYEARDYSQNLFTSIAESIHRITIQIIDDQAIQNYILCRMNE